MVQTAEEFIQSRLKSGEHFDVLKIQLFLKQLEQEKKYFLSNLYETTLIEEIEQQLTKPSKAVDEAKKELDEKKSDYAIAYNEFLIPRIENLAQMVGDDANCGAPCDSLIDEFITVYASFYSPKRYRSHFMLDANMKLFLRHRKGFDIPLSSNRVEANNLVVTPKNLLEARDCLGAELEANQFLSQDQIESLKLCGFDISRLEPMNSIFWKENKLKAHQVHAEYDHLFPNKTDKVFFSNVKFSGRGSPKIKGYFKRGDKKFKIKLKIGGLEPHAENFVGRMGVLLGLVQDVSVYRQQQEVYFKSVDDFYEFQTQIMRKFGERGRNFLTQIEDWKKGKKLTFRYVSMEANPKNLIKLGAPDVFGWDHKNRREFRGILLWVGFFNIYDLKNMNWRMQLRKTANGLKPELSMQDVGYSLGRSHTFSGLWDAAEIKTSDRNVNAFGPSFVTKKRNHINVKWVDFMSYERLFETTTYADLKWMARKILKISESDYRWALAYSGFSTAEQELYLRKIAQRRDELVDIFDLHHEQEKFQLGSYQSVNIPGLVEDGKVITTNAGSLYHYTNDTTMLTLGRFLQNKIDLNLFNQEFQLALGNQLGGELSLDLNYDLIKNKNFSVYLANPGVEVGFIREVRDSTYMNFEGGGDQRFYAIDRYSFGITSESGITSELVKFLPLELRTKVTHFKVRFEHYRPFASIGQAIRAPMTILEVLPYLKHYIKNLGRNESLTYSTETGLEVKLEVGEGNHYRVEVGHDRIKSNPITFSKNDFGEFEVFQEKIQQRRNYVQMNAGVQLPFLYIPLMGVEFSFLAYKAHSKLFHFPLPRRSLDDAIAQDQAKVDLELLDHLVSGNYGQPALKAKVKYALDMQGQKKSRRSFIAYLFGGQYDEIYSQTSAQYQNQAHKVFHRYYLSDTNTKGVDNMVSSYLLWSKDKSSIEVQLDDSEPEDFVVIMNHYQFKKDRTHYGLKVFIDELNERFSESTNFFNTSLLPPAKEVDHYKKVMSHVRVFLYAKEFLQRLDLLSDRNLWRIIRHHLNEKKQKGVARSIYNNLRTIRTILREKQMSRKRFAKLLALSLRDMESRHNGLGLIKSLFGQSHMFVMGEIYGIFPSFSYTQDYNSSAKRRYTGKSWGKYRKRPPFWKYLKDFPIMIRPGMIPYRIDEELFLPILPNGEALIH